MRLGPLYICKALRTDQLEKWGSCLHSSDSPRRAGRVCAQYLPNVAGLVAHTEPARPGQKSREGPIAQCQAQLRQRLSLTSAVPGPPTFCLGDHSDHKRSGGSILYISVKVWVVFSDVRNRGRHHLTFSV